MLRKTPLLLTICCLIFGNIVNAQKIHSGDKLIYSQSQLDAFALEGYTEIDGKLSLFGKSTLGTTDEIKDLSALINLEKVSGQLTIDNTDINKLNGLDNLAEAGGIVISDNDQLINLTGLEKLKSIVGRSLIMNNDQLSNIVSLQALSDAGDQFIILNNPKLTVVTFPQLATANYIGISGNDMLEDVELPSTVNIGEIFIKNNKKLTQCCSLFHLPARDKKTIEGNGEGCDSILELEISCGPSPEIDHTRTAIEMTAWMVHTADNINPATPNNRPYLINFLTKNFSQKQAALSKAKNDNHIPEIQDEEWKRLEISSNGDFNYRSHGNVPECAKQVDYTFFQTTVFVNDPNVMEDFYATYSFSDDASRLYVSKNDGELRAVPKSDLIKNGSEPEFFNVDMVKVDRNSPFKVDLKDVIDGVGKYRFVLAHFDNCGTGHQVKKIKLHLNGYELEPQAALHFDGENDFVELEDVDFYHASSTVEGWIKPEEQDNGQGSIITYVGDGISNIAHATQIENGKIRAILTNPPSHILGSNILSNKTVDDGQWHHFAMVVDIANEKMQLYIDGELDVERGIPKKGFDAAAEYKVHLGKFRTGFPKWFKGSMDEIRFWNVARTADEIKNNMNHQLAVKQGIRFRDLYPDLVAYYNFNQAEPNSDNRYDYIDDEGNARHIYPDLHDSTGQNKRGVLHEFLLRGPFSNFVLGAPVKTH